MAVDPSTEAAAQLAALEAFVAENDDLLALEERIGRFNIFDALGIARREINHSNFLAWLLDPSESHGQGDLFLKAVLMDMLKNAPPERRPLSAAHLDGTDLHDAEIRREWRHIDLHIACPSQRFAVIIENKVDSGEHSDQLARYEKFAREELHGLRPLFVFLTPNGEDASADDWVPYSYADLYRVLRRLRKMASGSLGVDVAAFLDHYLTLVRSRMMSDPEIDELCRKIYKNHKAAIDLLIERVGTGHEEFAQLLEWLDDPQASCFRRASGTSGVWMIPKGWVSRVSDELGRPLKDAPCDLYIEVQRWQGETKGTLSIRLVVGPGTDQARRAATVQALASLGFVLPKKGRLTAKFTRLSSKTLHAWEGDAGCAPAEVLSLVQGWLTEWKAKLDAVPSAAVQAS